VIVTTRNTFGRPPRNVWQRFGVFISEKISERVMYPWPIGDFDYKMDAALDIAMDYLERTGQAVKFFETERVAATAIVAAWKGGVRHRIKLADVAIKAVEGKGKPFLDSGVRQTRRG
jgi:hypothetical protein